MGRTVEQAKQAEAIKLMLTEGLGQREIERATGLSRPFLRKLADRVGYQFPRNGIEILGEVVCCFNCGSYFRRPKSKIDRAVRSFCDDDCRVAYQTGPNHPNWQGGESARTFSQWVQNQGEYQHWRKRALDRAENKCEVTGVTKDLQVHHILEKHERAHPDKVFDDTNAMVVSKEVHDRIHQLIREGFGYYEAIDKVKEEYKKGERKKTKRG